MPDLDPHALPSGGLAPAPASAAAQSFDRAVELLNSNNPADAYPLFIATVTDDPSHALAWFHISNLLFSDRKYPAAHAAMARVNALQPNNPRILTTLGWYAHADEDTPAGRRYLTRATKLGPDLALAWTNLSQIDIAQSDLDAALFHARKGLDLCNDGNPIHAMSLAFAHLFRGELLPGLDLYQARFRYKLQQFLAYAYPLWKGEHVRALFLRAEQGIGDTISTLRFLPEAASRADRVLCYVNAELRTLVEDMNLPNVEVFPLPAVLPSHADAWLPMMSLPMALNITTADLPATAPPFIPTYGAPTPHPGLNIGLVWSGSSDMDMDRWRSVPLSAFFPLFSLPNTRWVSLQKGSPQSQIVTEGAHGLIHDLSPLLTDMRETARAISSLDLVISCCTSVAHLAAAMGKPLILLRNRRSSDWRWGLGSGTPSKWYPQTQIFERDYHESWPDIIAKVRGALILQGNLPVS